MKHLKLFSTKEDFNLSKENLYKPWVTLTISDNTPHFMELDSKEEVSMFTKHFTDIDGNVIEYSFTTLPTYEEVFGYTPEGLEFKGWDDRYYNTLQPGEEITGWCSDTFEPIFEA